MNEWTMFHREAISFLQKDYSITGLDNIVKDRVKVEQRWLHHSWKNDMKEWPRFEVRVRVRVRVDGNIYTSPQWSIHCKRSFFDI